MVQVELTNGKTAVDRATATAASDGRWLAELKPENDYGSDPFILLAMREVELQACGHFPHTTAAIALDDLPLIWNVGPFHWKNPIHPQDKKCNLFNGAGLAPPSFRSDSIKSQYCIVGGWPASPK